MRKSVWVILYGNQRIAEELRAVPKKGGPGRGKRITPEGKSFSGKVATGIPGTSRSRLNKLADMGKTLRATAEQLWKGGKDATIKN